MSDHTPSRSHRTVAELVESVRWLRGRCLIERDTSEIREHVTASGIIVPDRELFDKHADRRTHVHVGRVLALGPPPRLEDRDGSPEVPWDVTVGDVVWYTYGVALQRLRTFDVEGAELVVVHAEELQAVHEPERLGMGIDPPEDPEREPVEP